MTRALQRTLIYEKHVSLGAKMVPFAGWEMPIQYSDGILAEVRAVRASAGIFDVSHMGRIWIKGPEAASLIDWVVTAEVHTLAQGRGRYTLICTNKGGILDDGIVYRLGEEVYLLVCNAGNFDVVWEYLNEWHQKQYRSLEIENRTLNVGMIAFQGPTAAATLEKLSPGLTDRVRPFRIRRADINGIPALVARTGYTGEDGFEIMPAASQSSDLFESLIHEGGIPCGLGARDILRLEAGLLLHGSDMSQETNPYEAGLERFLVLDKSSVWSPALDQIRGNGLQRKLTGFKITGRGVPRHGYPILKDTNKVGEVTSGGYSPTLDSFIGFGYVSIELANPGSQFVVDVRGRRVNAEAVALPFYSRRSD